MSVKVTYKEIIECRDALKEALSPEVKGLVLAESMPYIKMVKEVKNEVETFIEATNKLIMELGEDIPVEGGREGQTQKAVQPGTQAAEELKKQQDELLAQEVEIKGAPVKITITDKVEIPLTVLYAFEPFLKIGEKKAPSQKKS